MDDFSASLAIDECVTLRQFGSAIPQAVRADSVRQPVSARGMSRISGKSLVSISLRLPWGRNGEPRIIKRRSADFDARRPLLGWWRDQTRLPGPLLPQAEGAPGTRDFHCSLSTYDDRCANMVVFRVARFPHER